MQSLECADVLTSALWRRRDYISDIRQYLILQEQGLKPLLCVCFVCVQYIPGENDFQV